MLHSPFCLRAAAISLFALATASCATRTPPAEAPQELPNTPVVEQSSGRIVSSGRQSGPIFREDSHGSPIGSYRAPAIQSAAGDISLNFKDTDIHEVVKTVLGDFLKVNYTIDGGIQGSVTFHTSRALRQDELIPTLQTMLSQTGARLLFENNIFRIASGDDTTIVPPIVGSASGGSGSQVVPLRYTSAKQLAAIIEPYIGDGGKIAADPGHNALIVTGSSSARETVMSLVRTFDVDYMAGESFALFPVRSGDPAKVADNLEHALQASSDGPGSGALEVIPVTEVNAVLVISRDSAYLNRASRLMEAFDQAAETSGRTPHVFYPKNVRAADIQSVLQRTFNTGNGSGQDNSSTPGSLPPTAEGAQVSASGSSGTSSTGGGLTSGFNQGGQSGSSSSGSTTATSGTDSQGAKPLLGAVPATSVQASEGSPKILADNKSNCLIIMATDEEYRWIEATARKLDILPLQVFIEATIAEVTLTNDLQYGTQFYLKHNGLATTLSNVPTDTSTVNTTATTNKALFSGLLQPATGFSITELAQNAQVALEALKNITRVDVISSPTLLILDNEPARLQVGDTVPIISQSATSVLTTGAPVVNSVNYRDTGVILDVLPKINSGNLITLDIDQEVSQVVNTTTSAIDSPTFQERRIKSRVVLRDGETVSLAGLIQHQTTKDKSGIPLLSDIPILGNLFGTTTDDRSRTELVVLITPHVVHDDREMRTLSEALRGKISAIQTDADFMKPSPPSPYR